MARRPGVKGRELLIDAALRLFAEEGIDAVSIRAVNREAGLGPASSHYHFGTKEALIDAVVAVRQDSVSASIADGATDLAGQEAVSARALVTMLVRPYVDLMTERSARGRDWIRFAGQLTRTEHGPLIDPTTTEAVRAAAAKAYPDAGDAERARVLRLCFRVFLTQLAQTSSRPDQGRGAAEVELLIDFLSGGMDAALRPAGPLAARGA